MIAEVVEAKVEELKKDMDEKLDAYFSSSTYCDRLDKEAQEAALCYTQEKAKQDAE